jgi:hypothetical protein
VAHSILRCYTGHTQKNRFVSRVSNKKLVLFLNAVITCLPGCGSGNYNVVASGQLDGTALFFFFAADGPATAKQSKVIIYNIKHPVALN